MKAEFCAVESFLNVLVNYKLNL